MTASLAQDAIALLIDLAERGEIDPWDVKVIDVIDRFLTELAPALNGREAYDKSLSQSGQAFLYASMLVLLKADSLVQAEVQVEEELLEEADLFDLNSDEQTPLPRNLEKRLSRRATAQPPQRRRVTLNDLIAQLQAIAATLEDPSPRKRLSRPRPQARSQAVRAIAQLAHQENLSEMAVALEQFFADHEAELSVDQNWLDFEHLLELWANTEGPKFLHAHSSYAAEHRDRVGVFWALLLLSAQSKVELSQDEFYQDLKIRPLVVAPEANLG
ncbi:segregation/condensation protein A [Pantanalinema rosaneae CENA516]|uniref:segregation/condensation protein A n=1 Tax=Pantanalinema rosaneae TaxID=1620701 RepID=UPI003D70010C